MLVDRVVTGSEDPAVVLRVKTYYGEGRIFQIEMDLDLLMQQRIMGKPVRLVENMDGDRAGCPLNEIRKWYGGVDAGETRHLGKISFHFHLISHFAWLLHFLPPFHLCVSQKAGGMTK